MFNINEPDVKHIQKLRIEVLDTIYDLAAGSKRKSVSKEKLRSRINIEDQSYIDIIDFIKDENLILVVDSDEKYYITHAGIIKAEEYKLKPEQRIKKQANKR